MGTETDWKRLLEDAKNVMAEAIADKVEADEKFITKMKQARELANKAIKAGGKDAEQQWKHFLAGIDATLKQFEKEIRKVLDDLEDKFKIFGRVINWVKIRYFVCGAGLIALIWILSRFKL